MEEEEIKRGNEPIDGLYKAKVHYQGVFVLGLTAMDFIMTFLPNVILILVGATLLKSGKLNIGGWSIFFMYISQLMGSISGVVAEWADVKSAQGAIMRVSGIMLNPSEFEDTYPDKEVPSGNIQITGLDFSYGDKKVFDGLTLTIKEGKKTAIIGSSGGGKSTMLKLLERFYRVPEEMVSFGGRDINTFDVRKNRSAISYVSQEAPMFSGTVRENITYGINRGVTDEEIMEVLKASCADAFVNAMPNGLDSDIGENGDKLSGGQRQKLALARGLLKKANYLILDESTSSMDTYSAAEVQKSIDEFYKGRTCIMVSHNMNIVKDADDIIVISNGKVESEGTHEELLMKSPVYREFCQTDEMEA